MVQQFQGYPEEGTLVIATVTNIQYHSIFCKLDEYGKTGMMHISEVAPGRIKQIRDYVREGKTIIVKVLRIDEKKGHIDLSLRRVTEAQRRQKSTELKQQIIIEKILTQAGQAVKQDPKKLQETLEKKLLEKYASLYDAFQDVVEETASLTDLGVDKKLADALLPFVSDRIKPRSVNIKGDLSLRTYLPDGVEHIKKAFSSIPEEVSVFYKGAGTYAVSVDGPNYKYVEELLKEALQSVRDGIGADAEVQFERTDR